MPARRPRNQTLFDPRAYRYGSPGSDGRDSYANDVRAALLRTHCSMDEREAEIFEDLIQHEVPLVEGGLQVTGPLRSRIAGKAAIDHSLRSVELGGWIEEDRLEFLECSAKGILLIEKGTIYNRLRKAWRQLGMLMATGHGIPRPTARRVLHRLSAQFRLPVYLLTDCDTWGYFLFSILKRGSLVPNAHIPQLSVRDLRYLGIRARDAGMVSTNLLIRGRPQWDLRLRAMARYPCFKSKTWQNEFKAFHALEGKLESDALFFGTADANARRFVREYLEPKLHSGDWLK